MEPPNQADIDPSCQSGGSPFWTDYLIAVRTWVTPSEVRMKRCESEGFVLVPLAPVSRWIQLRGIGENGKDVSVFKDLNDCNESLGRGTRETTMPSPELLAYINKNYPAWRATLASVLKKLDKEVDFKNRKAWDEATRDKCRKLIPDDANLPMAVEVFRYTTCTQNDPLEDAEDEAQACIATNDPRLKGN